MKDADKIKLVDSILKGVQEQQEDKHISPKMIGHLNIVFGLNGFKKADIGTPVFDSGDRYFIMLETLDGKKCLEVTFYNDTLKSSIDFLIN